MKNVAVIVVLLPLAFATSARAQGARGGQLTGTFSPSTGGHVDEVRRPVKIESGQGPYTRILVGAGFTLEPQPIAYQGRRFGLPASLFPLDLVVEFCELTSIDHALKQPRCPTTTWTLARSIEIDANYEPINIKEAESNWFDPSKDYVLIWREGERAVQYSTPVRFLRIR